MPSVRTPASRPPVINQLIEGVDRYNPDNCELLENYLNAQCQAGEHDLMANLAILKLYQFNPELVNLAVVANILGKAITAIPEPDFNTCLFMLNDTIMADAGVMKLVELRQLLETSRYRDFWQLLHSDELAAKAVADIVGFEDAIRKVVAKVVSMTCQSIKKSHLEEYLSLSGNDLSTFITAQNWKSDGDSVQIPISKDNQAKTTITSENIKFEQLSKIIGYSATNL